MKYTRFLTKEDFSAVNKVVNKEVERGDLDEDQYSCLMQSLMTTGIMYMIQKRGFEYTDAFILKTITNLSDHEGFSFSMKGGKQP